MLIDNDYEGADEFFSLAANRDTLMSQTALVLSLIYVTIYFAGFGIESNILSRQSKWVRFHCIK